MSRHTYMKTARSKNNNFKKNNPINRNYVFDSTGPINKMRGTAQQLQEKYYNLAEDVSSSDDIYLKETFLQHAEHYTRILNSFAEQQQLRAKEQPTTHYHFNENNSSEAPVVKPDIIEKNSRKQSLHPPLSKKPHAALKEDIKPYDLFNVSDKEKTSES